jgi:purine-binding chemotaxis protein CheW
MISEASETPYALESTAGDSQWRSCLTFWLHGEEYGIDLTRVREICTYQAPSWIAGYPPYIPGVLNIRGEIVPIVDLRIRFGLEADFGRTTVTVVLNIDGSTVGIVVDSVSEVVELRASQIRPAPNFQGNVDAGFVTRLGLMQQEDRERMLILLDIEPLLASTGALRSDAVR